MRTYRPTEFSVLLKKIREGARKNRYSLSRFSGIDEAYLLRLESGERQNPSGDVVVKLGLALVAKAQSVTLQRCEWAPSSCKLRPATEPGRTISWHSR